MGAYVSSSEKRGRLSCQHQNEMYAFIRRNVDSNLCCLIRYNWPRTVYIFITAVSFLVILFLAPVENPNKRLDNAERKVYGRRTRIILTSESVLFLLALLWKWEKLTAVIAEGFAIVGTSLIAGQLKMRKFKE